ncbi:MAG: 16S rRNA (cytidine(1402)-2'-O)-methyltransferase [Ruminococcaceae bacterium]|nr:16S rRNA (cytidine(1402)-2'-O)-methyltransferase [Oscillospiraceae bacterium]
MSEYKNSAEEKNKVEGGKLYLVATPIGNLSDISERALKVLSEVDFIAAEDTRNSLRLLTHFGISKPMVSYHEHNRKERGMEIADRLISGESCALITDAGTPAISDPGEDMVALCAQRGIPVTSVPGACAAVTALTLSGLCTSRFVFEGFLPVQKKERRERLDELVYERRTFILHEAPHKLKATLADLEKALGGKRKISLCRELTKLNEDIFRTTLSGAVEYYDTHEPRGEYVLVIEGGNRERSYDGEKNMSAEEYIAYFIGEGMSKNDAIKATAKKLGIPRNDVYRLTIKE